MALAGDATKADAPGKKNNELISSLAKKNNKDRSIAAVNRFISFRIMIMMTTVVGYATICVIAVYSSPIIIQQRKVRRFDHPIAIKKPAQNKTKHHGPFWYTFRGLWHLSDRY
jgi:hypothetical protein